MSTRGIIARETGPGKFEGRYHHSDSYPEGLGAALYEAYNGHFKQDAVAMLKYLVDDHAAGWSFILGADYSLPPGYLEDHSAGYGKTPDGELDWSKPIPHGPRCYCHGDRHEESTPMLTDTEEAGTEWAYAINADTHEMCVYTPKWNEKVSEFTGYELIATVDMRGPEPDWDRIQCGEKLERCTHYAYHHFPELSGTSMERLGTAAFLGTEKPERAYAYIVRGNTWIATGNGSRKEHWNKKGYSETVWEELVYLEGEKHNRINLITRVEKDGKMKSAPGVKSLYPPTLKDPIAVFAEMRKSAKPESEEPADRKLPKYDSLLYFVTGRKFREE